MAFQHKELSDGRWFILSFAEQLGNIGSEVSRAKRFFNKDTKQYEGAVTRALELFDLTLSDLRWRGRLREIARAREVFCDAAFEEGRAYQSSLDNLDQYFFAFAMLARRTQ